MTIDIARMPNALAILDSTDDALARLAKWVEAASNAQRLVAPLVGTPFVPDAYRPRIERGDTEEQIAEKRSAAVANATAAVLYGLSLNIDPLMALQQIYVVHGRPGMYAKMMVALVQSRGHDVWTEDLTDTRAVVCGRRKGSAHTERVVITMEIARRGKWTSNPKYQETPQDMLWARAAGRVCDRIASDVLKGIATVEQIQDEIQATAEVGKRTVTPRHRPAIEATTADDPPLDFVEASTPGRLNGTAAEPTTDPAPTAEMMTPAQGKKLYAAMRDKGVGDKALGLGYISDLLLRDVTSTKDLTKAEARQVIDALEQLADPPPASEPDPAISQDTATADGDPTLDADGWPPAAQAADPDLHP